MFASAPVSMEFQKPPYLNRQPIIHQPKVSAYQIHCALIAGGLLKGELARGPWRDKNQRQIRKDRRRAFAAGNRKAFK